MIKRPAFKPLTDALAPALERLRTQKQRFNQRQARERVLMIGVGMAAVLALCDAVFIGPGFKAYKAAQLQQQSALQQQTQLETDAQQVGSLAQAQAQLRRAELAAWRQRAREGEAMLRSHEDSLIGPEQMLALLEQVLARHGQVRVHSMRSLDRVDLLADRPLQLPGAAPAPGAASAPARTASGNAPSSAAVAAAAREQAASAPGGADQTLYRHGVELVLEGGFNELLAYLQALEALPQHVLWGGMSLKVQQHPSSLLTLRLYTVSRERHWLEI